MLFSSFGQDLENVFWPWLKQQWRTTWMGEQLTLYRKPLSICSGDISENILSFGIVIQEVKNQIDFVFNNVWLCHRSCVYRAVQKRADLSCLWKLLGDACTKCSSVSPNRICVLVPGVLCGTEPSDKNHTLDQKQLLSLGERWVSQHTRTPHSYSHVRIYTVIGCSLVGTTSCVTDQVRINSLGN